MRRITIDLMRVNQRLIELIESSRDRLLFTHILQDRFSRNIPAAENTFHFFTVRKEL